jgi:hypothetical protein
MNHTCNYSITQEELLNYLETRPPQIAIFCRTVLSNNTESLTCLMFDNNEYKQYVANIQIGLKVAATNLASSRTELSSNEGMYDLILKTYQEGIKRSDEVFFDIVTSYNIYLLLKNPCNKYAKDKIILDFHDHLQNFSDMDYLTFLHIFLGINYLCLSLDHVIASDILRDYSLNEENDQEYFYIKFGDYSNINYINRLTITNYIEEEIRLF